MQEGRRGFFRALPRHGVAFFRRGPRLVVTFDNMKDRDGQGPQLPWGHDWLARRGDSQLGVMMARRNDWFRHGALFDLFDESSGAGFFAGFSVAAPGARVVALVPQTRLDPLAVPWEGRYRRGYERGDWRDSRYRDGAAADGAHHLRLPFAGHRVGRHLLHMGLLDQTMSALVEGRLDVAQWRGMVRARHDSLPWCRALVAACLARDRPLLPQRVVDWIHDAQEGWHIPRLEREVRTARG